MRRRWLVSVTLLCLVQPVGGGDKAPAIVMRVRSLDALLENAKLLVNLTGEDAAARQIEGLLKAKVGVKGIEGIDPKRPLGAYVRFGKEIGDISGAVLVPIADEKSFLDLLARFNWLTNKGKNDIYTVQTGRPFDLYFRFVERYAYVTGINPDNLLDQNVIGAGAVLGGEDRAVLTTSVRLDRLPEGAKLLAQFQLEQELQKAQAKGPRDETEAQRAFRVAVLRELAQTAAGLLKEGAELRIDVGIDEAAQEFRAQVALSGQAGTDMAAALARLGKSQSPFTGLFKKDLAMLGAVNLALPETVNDALAKVIDEVMARSLAELRDAQKKQQAEGLFQSLLPTLRAGRLDGVFALSGPVGKNYTMLGALAVRDGAKLGKTIHQLVAQAVKDLPEREQDKIRLDFDKAGGVAIHKFELPAAKQPGDVQFQELVGSRDLYVAFRDDGVLLAVGPAALGVLKEALASRDKAATPLFVFHFDAARLVPILAKTRAQQELAARIFAPGQDSSLRIAVSAGDDLRLRLQLKLSALEFLAKLKDDKR
jgi:hypothetical protein